MSPEPELDPESKAAELVDALLGAGEPVDEGGFTLDAAAAAAKLAEFRYADRSFWPLPTFEGLLGLGATTIELDTRAAAPGLRIRARGRLPASLERALPELYACAVGRSRTPLERALGRLAIGLDMFVGGDPIGLVRVAYDGLELQLRPRAAPEPRGLPTREQPPPGELWLTFVRGPEVSEIDPLRARLRAALRFATVEVLVDGQRISGEAREWFATQAEDHPGFRVRVGLERHSDEPGVVELWTGGLCVEQGFGGGPAARAVVELDAPRRDLGQIRIARDETLAAAFAVVEQLRARALAELEAADASWTRMTRPPEWSPARVDRVLARPPRDHEQRDARDSPISSFALIEQLGVETGWSTFKFGFGLAGTLSAPVLTVLLALEPTAAARGDWTMPLGFALIGVGLFGSLARTARAALRARDHGHRLTARITAIEPVSGRRAQDGPDARIHWELVEPAPGSGRRLAGRSLRRKLADGQRWTVGEQILVYWDPHRPEQTWWRADLGPHRA